jgi:hypothetical protein
MTQFRPPHWFIIDVESVGLHGEAFAVAWQVFDTNADPLPFRNGAWASFDPNYAKGTDPDRKWVEKNVPDLKPYEGSMRGIRERFWLEWEDVKKEFPGIVMAAECAWPVEANFLNQCIADDPIKRCWTGPYPLHDIASIMLAAGMDPMATYSREHEDLSLYPPHHPLGDVKHSAWCLRAALGKLNR